MGESVEQCADAYTTLSHLHPPAVHPRCTIPEHCNLRRARGDEGVSEAQEPVTLKSATASDLRDLGGFT